MVSWAELAGYLAATRSGDIDDAALARLRSALAFDAVTAAGWAGARRSLPTTAPSAWC